MPEYSKERIPALVSTLFGVLWKHPEGADADEAIDEVLRQHGLADDPNAARYKNALRRETANAVRDGWMMKRMGTWWLTSAGQQRGRTAADFARAFSLAPAADQPTDSDLSMNSRHVQLLRKGAAALKEWRLSHPDTQLNLSNAHLENVKLAGADLSFANLANAHLSDADLRGTVLRNADLTEANLTRAHLMHADLRRSVLRRAWLTGVDLTQSDLSGVMFSDDSINLQHAFSSAQGREADTRMRESYLSGANLKDASLVNTRIWSRHMRNVNLDGANLTRAQIIGCDLSGASLAKANFTDARLENSDLSNTNCSDTIFVGASLFKATMRNALIRDADFTDADMRFCDLDGAVLNWSGKPKLPEPVAMSKYWGLNTQTYSTANCLSVLHVFLGILCLVAFAFGLAQQVAWFGLVLIVTGVGFEIARRKQLRRGLFPSPRCYYRFGPLRGDRHEFFLLLLPAIGVGYAAIAEIVGFDRAAGAICDSTVSSKIFPDPHL